jgi:hypothetical protein
MAMKPIPPRIHVLLARKAKVGLVIRRGPSKTTCTLLWNLRTNEFALGQWVRARIYERRCDLSPDGKHMIYFAMNGRWDSRAGGSWTAISRVPYLKALTLYPKGNCWFGGGLFLGNHTYWLNGGREDHRHPILVSSLQADPLFKPQPSYGGECPSVYYHRIQRDGWKFVQHRDINDDSAFDVFEKDLIWGWKLRKIARSEIDRPPGKGVYYDKHELFRFDSNEQLSLEDWEWADYISGRVVWAARGRVFAAEMRRSGIFRETELYDFNEMQFEAIKAPY